MLKVQFGDLSNCHTQLYVPRGWWDIALTSLQVWSLCSNHTDLIPIALSHQPHAKHNIVVLAFFCLGKFTQNFPIVNLCIIQVIHILSSFPRLFHLKQKNSLPQQYHPPPTHTHTLNTTNHYHTTYFFFFIILCHYSVWMFTYLSYMNPLLYYKIHESRNRCFILFFAISPTCRTGSNSTERKPSRIR